MIKAIAFAAGLVFAAPAAAFVPAATLSGYASAVDGDDIAFGHVRVRLRGVAAPEDRPGGREPGGAEATRNLAEAVEGRWVVCQLDGTTAGSTRRPVGQCFANGVDLADWQVRSGVARDCPHFSGGDYAGAEAAARAGGRRLSMVYPLPGYCVEGQ